MSAPSRAKRAFRVATLFVPSWLAWYVAFSAERPDALVRAVSHALGPLWALLVGAVALRLVGGVFRTHEGGWTRLEAVDLLTARGSALAWTSAAAIVFAVWLGWASLAVVGLLGTALFHVVTLYAFAVVPLADPLRGGAITRRFVPGTVTEGDRVIEELRVSGVRVPVGFRLFAAGRIGPRWATSRHVFEAADSGAELVVESDVGAAVRGEHEAEPLEVWLADTFGLCRSPRAQLAKATLTVLPRLRDVRDAAPLLGRGIGPRASRPASRQPTEGHLHLREYQQGDDVRRIHWVRSLASRELIVRLPDELPPDQPRVRVVLDTFFPPSLAFATDSEDDLLDAVVATWLAVGGALAERGARVTMVAPVVERGSSGAAGQLLDPRDPEPVLRLAARATWQHERMVNEMMSDEATFVVSRGVLAPPPPESKVRWIVVAPPPSREEPRRVPSAALLPYPMGSADNRLSRRRRAAARSARELRDRARARAALGAGLLAPPPGSLVAHASSGGPIRLEALR